MIKNYVTFVIDKSVSMASLVHKVPQVYRELVEGIKKDAKDSKQYTEVRVMQFGSTIQVDSKFVAITELGAPSLYYNPNEGSTRLWDAVTKAINTSLEVPRKAFENIAHLVIVITDGEDNASRDFLGLNKLVNLDNVTVAWNVPSTHGRSRIVNFLGESAGNINIWETTEQGMDHMLGQTVSAYSVYTTSRASGQTKSKSFYVTTDLSQLNPKDLKQCENRTNWFVPKKVEKEQRIDEFVNSLGGRPYIKGMAFYQLTKPEEIQGTKDVLIREKGKKTIYGGQKVRELLGIPAYQTGKIKPGNHANYDIFIQSSSDNRKLVRGTTLMVAK